jgi:excisionase family DNA binding protein
MEPLLLKPIDVAHLLGVSKSKVYELLATGNLPSVRIGKSIRISTQELRAWIAARTLSASAAVDTQSKGKTYLHQ